MADSTDWRDWVRYAENDWLFAHEGLERFPAQSAFLLHQSAEKYLKAALLRAGLEPPQSHNLLRLLDLLDPALAIGSHEATGSLLNY